MSRQRDCVRCGSEDLLPENYFHTSAGTICRACAVEDMWLVAAALGIVGGFSWDREGMTLTWDDMRALLAGFGPDEPVQRHTKSRTLTITALDAYRAEQRGVCESDEQLEACGAHRQP